MLSLRAVRFDICIEGQTDPNEDLPMMKHIPDGVTLFLLQLANSKGKLSIDMSAGNLVLSSKSAVNVNVFSGMNSMVTMDFTKAGLTGEMDPSRKVMCKSLNSA